MLPKYITDAIDNLSNLPGIGSRSAERLVFSLLKNESNLAHKIGETLINLKSAIKKCEECGNYCEKERKLCNICDSSTRDEKILCVVETPMDLIALEKTHEFKGKYHILHGVISPIEKVLPTDLNLSNLFKKNFREIEEIILATSGTTESEATSLYIVENLKPIFNGKITRLARGIPSGGDLDYLDMGTISRAFLERIKF